MKPDLLVLLKSIQGRPVLCLGDVMLDIYLRGEASRLSPEAPVPVVLIKNKLAMPGAMGNVARNLEAILARPLPLCVLSGDENSRRLQEHLNRPGGLAPVIINDPSRPTIVKTRVIAGIQQVVRIDEEEAGPLSSDVEAFLLEALKRHIGGVGAVIISDYGKGTVTPKVAAEAISLARAGNIPVVVDPKGADYSKYAGATLITPNRKELAEAAGRKVHEEPDLAEAGRAIMSACSVDNLLITLSEQGMLLIKGERPEAPIHIPARVKDVFDVSGAGDTVVAVMASALAAGGALEVAAELAALAAGVVVGKVGTAVAHPQEIEAAALNHLVT